MSQTPQTSQVSRSHVQKLTLAAILTAFGILIPMIMPIKVIIGPASYTLASHVPIFIAMFISPVTALVVSLGASFGFFASGFPIVIVARALTHAIFATIGAYILAKYPDILKKPLLTLGFALGVNVIHAIGEVSAVYFLTASSQASSGYWYTLFVLVGIGTIIHGTVDFYIARYIWKFLQKV